MALQMMNEHIEKFIRDGKGMRKGKEDDDDRKGSKNEEGNGRDNECIGIGMNMSLGNQLTEQQSNYLFALNEGSSVNHLMMSSSLIYYNGEGNEEKSLSQSRNWKKNETKEVNDENNKETCRDDGNSVNNRRQRYHEDRNQKYEDVTLKEFLDSEIRSIRENHFKKDLSQCDMSKTVREADNTMMMMSNTVILNEHMPIDNSRDRHLHSLINHKKIKNDKNIVNQRSTVFHCLNNSKSARNFIKESTETKINNKQYILKQPDTSLSSSSLVIGMQLNTPRDHLNNKLYHNPASVVSLKRLQIKKTSINNINNSFTSSNRKDMTHRSNFRSNLMQEFKKKDMHKSSSNTSLKSKTIVKIKHSKINDSPSNKKQRIVSISIDIRAIIKEEQQKQNQKDLHQYTYRQEREVIHKMINQ